MTPTDTLARTIWGEARSEGYEGMQAVASVVLNRIASGKTWWGADIESVCLEPWQFSCWNANDPNRAKLLAVDQRDDQFVTALEISAQAVAGTLPDNTNGATTYKVTSLPWPAEWGEPVDPVAVIGQQSFYVLAG